MPDRDIEMRARVEVIQADRDAAGDYAQSVEDEPILAFNLRHGRCDNGPRVQAFARHRLAALSASPLPGREEIAREVGEALQEVWKAVTIADREAAARTAYALGVPDVQGERQHEIIAREFARARLLALCTPIYAEPTEGEESTDDRYRNTDNAFSETVPIAIIIPPLEGARAALAHLAKTLPDNDADALPLAASYAAHEASRLAAAIALLTPTPKGTPK